MPEALPAQLSRITTAILAAAELTTAAALWLHVPFYDELFPIRAWACLFTCLGILEVYFSVTGRRARIVGSAGIIVTIGFAVCWDGAVFGYMRSFPYTPALSLARSLVCCLLLLQGLEVGQRLHRLVPYAVALSRICAVVLVFRATTLEQERAAVRSASHMEYEWIDTGFWPDPWSLWIVCSLGQGAFAFWWTRHGHLSIRAATWLAVFLLGATMESIGFSLLLGKVLGQIFLEGSLLFGEDPTPGLRAAFLIGGSITAIAGMVMTALPRRTPVWLKVWGCASWASGLLPAVGVAMEWQAGLRWGVVLQVALLAPWFLASARELGASANGTGQSDGAS